MRAAFKVGLVAILFSVLPLAAQNSQVLISIGGADFGTTGINALGAGWSLEQRHVNVQISAELSNGGGSGRGIAYLMRSIGPGTTCGAEVAQTKFDLPLGFHGMLTLFTGLDLPRGDYWLVFSHPRSGPFSYANWHVSNPATFTTASTVRYLGTTFLSSADDIAEYVPASNFGIMTGQWAYHLEVTGEPAGPAPPRRRIR